MLDVSSVWINWVISSCASISNSSHHSGQTMLISNKQVQTQHVQHCFDSTPFEFTHNLHVSLVINLKSTYTRNSQIFFNRKKFAKWNHFVREWVSIIVNIFTKFLTGVVPLPYTEKTTPPQIYEKKHFLVPNSYAYRKTPNKLPLLDASVQNLKKEKLKIRGKWFSKQITNRCPLPRNTKKIQRGASIWHFRISLANK